jgi:Predicted metal-dependent phosphoesterases (PHP family)
MLISPYNEKGNWYRGNLHCHTENSSCGTYPISRVMELYTQGKLKYDFLAITDHFLVTDLKEVIDDEKIILFQGEEFKGKACQTLGINIDGFYDDADDIDNFKELFENINHQGGFNIICHPHLNREDYWPLEKLLNLEGYLGIEIYNNNVRMDNSGRALATDIWDQLLSNGKKVYGFANDDMHVLSRCGGAFNMVLCENRTRNDIISAIRKGSFYSSTGVFINSITTHENSITVETTHTHIPVTFKFIGQNGKILAEVFGSKATYKCEGDEQYVRVELHREDAARAWTQPFYIK